MFSSEYITKKGTNLRSIIELSKERLCPPPPVYNPESAPGPGARTLKISLPSKKAKIGLEIAIKIKNIPSPGETIRKDFYTSDENSSSFSRYNEND